MTVTTLTVHTSSEAGSRIDDLFTAATATDGDKFLNTGGDVILLVKNLTATPTTLTINGVGEDNFGQVVDGTLTVTGATAPGKFWVFGPFSTRHYNDASDYCLVNWSQVASVSVLAVKLGAVVG